MNNELLRHLIQNDAKAEEALRKRNIAIAMAKAVKEQYPWIVVITTEQPTNERGS